MKHTTFLTLFLITLCSSVHANRLKHISTHNGLSSKRTFSIEKDNKDYIWISTRSGIDRYDGRNIKPYLLVDETGSEDLTGRINMLVKDKSGNLWAYTNFGQIFQYNYQWDSYTLKLNLTQALDVSTPYLTGILFADDEHMLVFGSFGIWIYNMPEGTFKPIDKFENVYIFTITSINKSTFAVATDKGVYITSFNFDKYTVVEKTTTSVGLNERVQCMHYEKFDSTLLLGTFTGKLFLYSLQGAELKKLDFDFKTSVRDIKCYNNTIYIGTNGAGLVTINKNTKELQESYINTILNELNVTSYAFYNILYDENRLWLATYSDGVYVLDENLPDFRTLPYQPREDGEKTNSLNTFLEDSDGNFWFGTNDGVFRYHVKNNTWTHLLKNDILNNVTRYNALALGEDDEGYIWVGGAAFGLASCINKQTLEIKENYYFSTETENPVNGRIYSIFKDSDGNMWLGGLHGVLTKFNPKSKGLKHYDIKSINTITEFNNIVLIGTIRGLYIQNKNNDSFTHILTTERLGSSMLSYINSIYEDKLGILWLGTEGGLLRYDRNADDVKVYTKSEGLLTNAIFGILSDKRNRLWLSTDKGLICFTPQDNNFIYFGTEEGITDERFSPRSLLCRENGELLFGNHNGVVSFMPEKIDRLKVNSKLVFTNFSINYRIVYPSANNSILNKHIDETSKIELKHDQNTFSFGFTSINFTNPHRTRFEWKLEGYDKDWIKEIDINTAHYTNVPPGTYQFILRTINTNDELETGRKTILLDIRPPIWATFWAKLFYIIVSAILLWIIIQFIRERLEKRSASEKIRFFTHTAHELKTPVALIKGPLNKLQEKENLSPEGEVLLNLVVKNTERLNHLVMQLLDFQKTELTEVKLYVSEKELTGYIREKIEAFNELVKQKNINLSLILNTNPVNVWFDEDKMDKIINNLLSNAFKYTPQNGRISVTVGMDKTHWTIEVRDNGIGIPENVQREIFKPFYRADNAVNSTETGSGIGLLLTRNLVRLHHGSISFESLESTGTVFTVKIPCGTKHFNKNKTVFVESKVQEVKKIEQDNNKKLSIEIVEDNDELRFFLNECLNDKYIVHEARNGSEGIKLAKIVLPELIISDVMMPGMNGYELCRQIKASKETSHIPIILLTALDDKSNILKGYEYGADNYVTKPFDTEILKLTIENTIATRQSLRRNLIRPLQEEIADEKELITNELDKQFLDEVMAIIDKNISDSEFSINDLCREVAMSRTSFYNKMKVLTNQSPNEFIRLVRLNRAAKMLKEKDYSITEVASSTGFGDVKYFSTAFKKQFGVSPKKYGKNGGT